MNPETPPPAPVTAADVARLHKELRDMGSIIRVMLTVVYVLISYLSFTALLSMPRFEKIFEDMLPDPDQMPTISRAVIAWSNLAPYSLLLLLGVIVTGITLMATARSIRTVGVAFAACIVPLFAHLLVCWMAMYAPLIEVIKGLSAGPV